MHKFSRSVERYTHIHVFYSEDAAYRVCAVCVFVCVMCVCVCVHVCAVCPHAKILVL